MKQVFLAMLLSATLLVTLFEVKERYLKPENIAPGGLTACEKTPDWLSRRQTPLYILPLVNDQIEVRPELEKFMETLEPGGAQGHIQLGHTLGVVPLALMSYRHKEWQPNMDSLDVDLQWAARVGRPFVVYIMNNHFQTEDPQLVKDLLKDARNLMSLREHGNFGENYFKTKLLPFTLSDDTSIPVNTYKVRSLQAIAARLAAFDRAHPGLLVGIELNGETHFLFPDFFNGTGNFATPELMDYSPLSLQAFAAYLREHGIEDDAERIKRLDFRHYDAGYLPVSGWLDEPSGIAPVEIYVDGKLSGYAERPINRLDVFENEDADVTEPNTGFSYLLDVSRLAAGRHHVEAVLIHEGKRELIGAREFTVGEERHENSTPRLLAPPAMTSPVRGWLDHPANGSVVRFDPLARAWINFRAQQVERHVAMLAKPFRQAGFKRSQLFSYQIAPWMFGGWNEQLFGVGRDFFNMPDVTPGINLYGGNFINPGIFRYVDPSQGYAVPEMHPQMKNARDKIEKGMRMHYCMGATYLGPYFLLLKQKEKMTEHERFRLTPDNPDWGSDDFFHVIEEMVRQ